MVQVLYFKEGRELVELSYMCHSLHVKAKQNSAFVSDSLAYESHGKATYTLRSSKNKKQGPLWLMTIPAVLKC